MRVALLGDGVGGPNPVAVLQHGMKRGLGAASQDRTAAALVDLALGGLAASDAPRLRKGQA